MQLMSRVCKQISHSADGFGYPLLTLCLYLWGGTQAILFTQAIAITFLFERPVYFILKHCLKRNRPAEVLKGYQSFIIPSDQFSFPSGHTSAAFVVATLLYFTYPLSGPFAYTWAALVGLSRVTLGVHFFTDIIAGAAIGASLAYLTFCWVCP